MTPSDFHDDPAGEPSDEAPSPMHDHLRRRLEREGVHPRNQATLVAEVCHISVSQARRKLNGAAWLFDEIAALADHCGCTIDALTRAPVDELDATAPQPAQACFDGQHWPCEVVVGRLLAPKDQGRVPLQAVRDGQGWLVGREATLTHLRPQSPRYAVDRLTLHGEASRTPVRVAVVDDDVSAAESLCDWFETMGMVATPLSTPDRILSANPLQFDAFVVDFILGHGLDSRALIEHIRMTRPHAPIALLTGHLRDGRASEDDLTTLMRSLQVMFFEKPVRPGVVAAAIQNSMDRAGAAPHG